MVWKRNVTCLKWYDLQCIPRKNKSVTRKKKWHKNRPKILFPFRHRTAAAPNGHIIYYLCKSEHHIFGLHSTWSTYSMRSLGLLYLYVSIFNTLLLSFFHTCLHLLLWKVTKFLNMKEVMDKEMIRDNI